MRSSIRYLCATLLAALIAPGCRPAPPPPLRIAANPWPGYEFLFLAEQKGFFLAESVDVRLVETMALADTRRAFERRQVDIFGGTLVELLLSRQLSDRKAQVFYLCDYSNGSDVILARPPLAAVPDLKGKRIGVEPASVNLTLLAAALHRHALTLRDVIIIPLAQDAMPAAAAGMAVDALVSYPPVSLHLQRAGFTAIFDSTQVPGEIVDVLAADADVLRTRPRDCAAVVRAFVRAQRFAAEHPDEAHSIMAGRERISVPEFRSALAGIRIVPFHEQAAALAATGSVTRALRRTAEALAETGQAPTPHDDFTTLVRDRFVRCAAPPHP
jgi:NitT/TauT family transport system substrate-binding protein